MTLIVQKFGGTSVADIKNIKNVATIIKTEYLKGINIIVVVSAMAGITNQLISKCSKISNLNNKLSMREYDAAVASGEIVTAALLALELQNYNIQAQSLQGWQVPIYTNNNHGNSQAIKIIPNKLKIMLQNGIVPIITGFQGITQKGDITTLGKGGSDISAALIAASLQADRCDIYTDVEGIYSTDPRIVHDAYKLDKIDINQLYILCSYGAKVLHPRAAILAKNYNFQLRILSSFSKTQGTTIIKQNKTMETPNITAITSNKNLLKIIIKYKNLNWINLLDKFVQESIDIHQANHFDNYNSANIIVDLTNQNRCQMLLDHHTKNGTILSYNLDTNIAILAIVGYGMKNDYNLLKQINKILHNNQITVSSLHVDDFKISLIINDQYNEQAIKLLHKKFCTNEDNVSNSALYD